MRKNKTFKKWLLLLISCMVVLLFPASVHASAKLVKLSPSKTYTTYDITRDGKKDKIKYTTVGTPGHVQKMYFYVNGKRFLLGGGSMTCRGVTVHYYSYNRQNTFLFCNAHFMGGGEQNMVFVYSGGKFKCIEIDYYTWYGATSVSKASGNYVYFDSYKMWPSESFKCFEGKFQTAPCRLKFKAENGTLKLVSKTYDIVGYPRVFYAKNSFSTSKSLSRINVKDGPTVKKGQKVTLDKVNMLTYKGKTVYRINVNGKTGWFVDGKSIQFSNKPLATTLTLKCSGSTGKRTITLKAASSLGGKITWSTSNSRVATVSSNGTVTAKGNGSAKITAKVTVNGITASKSYTVTVGTKSSTSYGAWSSWSLTPVSGTSTREVQTKAFYRYYCFLCPVCGRREPFQGISDCHRYTLSLSNGVVKWSSIPYYMCNSQFYSYTNLKRYTTSLGDGLLWNFSAGNINDTAIGTKDASGPDTEIIKCGYRWRSKSTKTTNYIKTVK
ncbi:MAG: Ig-like domain-containing protein [Blautia sp.]|nr:Ig-like domain-containing protein [Blautia sp.]